VPEISVASDGPSEGSETVSRMALLGYARVSTLEQDPALQHDALAAAGCVRVFTDRASGALDERVELARVLDHAREGDTVVVWRLDRLGRSLRHLVDTVTELEQRGVGFRSLSESIDTTTPGGKLVFHIFAALAEFERDLISERTRAGLEAARARGRNGGRPSVMTAEKLRVARELYDAREHTTAQIARVLGVSRATLYRHLTPAAPTPETSTSGT
jgi:DNA invertase Pin-like site-specific DNA recombinase